MKITQKEHGSAIKAIILDAIIYNCRKKNENNFNQYCEQFEYWLRMIVHRI